MGVKCSSSHQSIVAYFNAVIGIVKEEMINGLSYIGEQCITKIRDRSNEESWIDRTGNLRTSIGYGVSDHGRRVVESAFKQVLQGTQGAQEGKALLEELTKQYADTYALIVVAGMNYADRVEAMESKDVLASTELWAKNKLDDFVKRIVKKIEQRIKKLKL